MIEDAAFAEYETDGETPPERIETVLSAIFFVLLQIAASNGINPEYIEQYAGNVYATRPRKYTPPTPEEMQKREDDEVRRSFAGTLSKMKFAIQHGKNTISHL